MEHLYHGYKWSSTQHSSQVILRPTSNHHQMECPCCSTCFCFMVSFFYSWCLCTSTKYDHHWKKTRLLARIRVVCPFLQLETPIFFLLQQRTNWALHLSAKSHSGWWFQPLWKIWKSIGMIIPNIWKNKKSCSKPPTSISSCLNLVNSCQIRKKNMQLESPRYLLGGPWLVSCNASTGGSRSTGHQGTPPTRSGK